MDISRLVSRTYPANQTAQDPERYRVVVIF
ncbi:hypothetical protein DFAR_200046 [Desulfarculales bacterium]